MMGTKKGAKRLLAAVLAGTMALSFASCALFGNAKEITAAADTFASTLIKLNAKKIIKLTNEKKSSETAAELEALMNEANYSKDQNEFIDAVADTLTYTVSADTVKSENDKASVDVVFTMVDYEKALKGEDCEDIDDVIDALKDCDDTKDVKVGLEFEKKGDSWLVSNLDDKDFRKLFEFYTYDLGISPDLSSMVDYSYTDYGSYWLEFDVYFTEDVSQYYDLFSFDVYYEGDLIDSGMVPYVYEDEVWCDYYNDWNDLSTGEYTIVLKCGDKEVTSATEYVYNDSYDDVDYDYDYNSDIYGADVVTYGYGPEVINLWSFTNEVPNMVGTYMDLNDDFASEYTVVCTIIPTSDGQYQPNLDTALDAGGSNAPDIYTAEAAFVLKYSQGDMSSYAATYEDLGIDVDSKIAAADIAQYTVDVGSRNGDVVALGYQATGGAVIYRRSVAIEVFGTDDPEEIEEIIGGGTGSWDKFWDAAETCADNGVAIVSGEGDIWHAVENSNEAWINSDGTFNTDTGRFDFFDMAYDLTNNGWTNCTWDWTEGWYADMQGTGEKPVFCFFGPAWLINYVMEPNCGDTYGDWAVCASPVGFFWGGTWIFANKDTDQKEGVAELIEWITLDTSTTGLQYMWANDLMGNGAKDTVASGTVMAMSDGTLGFLDGQNMFAVYTAANQYATGDNMTEFDDTINSYFRDAVRQYAFPDGEYYGDYDGAISYFLNCVGV